eukprot:CAMPEP_0168569676 /NCGR_PEP_ID=MMETSP0413-20121227/16300_1 /TAXON_ID=136452 /ORGANISM="Filamoeba nolandi, Strain NC-AS-23-1" /LENGTH=318 /DNA_ID=CAMNT_0008602219 /DNA_START=225 /DNA_END=1181 /DNA_ORIENTATION=+
MVHLESAASDADYPLDEWMSRAERCELLREDEMKKLTDLVKSYLLEESNLQPVSTPAAVCGDIHGQFYDLLELFKTGGRIEESNTNYVFLGDYVDRGHHSVETFTFLMLLKAKYPSRITMIRGNHESREISTLYGFYDEVQHKYGSVNVWKYCTSVFDYLPLTAIIDGRVLCVHGGLSPEISCVDQIRTIRRNADVPHSGAFSDLLWSDPEPEVSTWKKSTRGAGYVFGQAVVREFNHLNGLELICRSHQLVYEGYHYVFGEETGLVTVWSAPNYCYQYRNLASVLSLDENLKRDFKIFRESQESSRKAPRSTPFHFM